MLPNTLPLPSAEAFLIIYNASAGHGSAKAGAFKFRVTGVPASDPA
jgi:hypothetical protein